MQQIFSKIGYTSVTLPRDYSLFPVLKKILGEGAQDQNCREVRMAVITVAKNTGQGLPSVRYMVNKCNKYSGNCVENNLYHSRLRWNMTSSRQRRR